MTRQLRYAFPPHNARPDGFSTPSHHTTQDPTASLRLPITQHKARQLQYAFPCTQLKIWQFQYTFPPHSTKADGFIAPFDHTKQNPTASVRICTTKHKTSFYKFFKAIWLDKKFLCHSIFYLKAKINKIKLIRVNKGNNKITELRNDIYIIHSFQIDIIHYKSPPRFFGGVHVAHISLVFCVVLPCAFTFWVPFCAARYSFRKK